MLHRRTCKEVRRLARFAEVPCPSIPGGRFEAGGQSAWSGQAVGSTACPHPGVSCRQHACESDRLPALVSVQDRAVPRRQAVASLLDHASATRLHGKSYIASARRMLDWQLSVPASGQPLNDWPPADGHNRWEQPVHSHSRGKCLAHEQDPTRGRQHELGSARLKTASRNARTPSTCHQHAESARRTLFGPTDFVCGRQPGCSEQIES